MSRSTFWQAIATRQRLGWALYDWANSAFVLCVVTVVGSAYFIAVFESAAREAGDATLGGSPAMPLFGVMATGEALWSYIIAAAALFVAVTSPLLGAIADAKGAKKRFLQVYCLVGVAGTLALYFAVPWWAVALFLLLGNIGFEGGNVFYNAFLPQIAEGETQDYLSSWGYAAGYIGVVVLIATLLFFVPPQGSVNHAFVLIGLWWGGFALITFWLLKEQPGRRPGLPLGETVRGAWRELRTTVANIRHTPEAGKFLLAYLLYNDGIATLISNATPYALQNIYVDEALTQRATLNELIPAIIMIQFVAAPGAAFCGWLATRIGEKGTVFYTLTVFTGVVFYGQFATLIQEFYVMAFFIGLVLGGSQAISRAIFSKLVPPGKYAEYFAFFALSAKFSAMIGPLIYGTLLLVSGETRTAILSLVVFFVIGGAVLSRVDIGRGRQQALTQAV